ncbi:MAG: BACON domain-containing protein [Gemmatimonadetes bacterium]|nr:BACON domain-containing protein [Gemmatimonadota bacterium]
MRNQPSRQTTRPPPASRIARAWVGLALVIAAACDGVMAPASTLATRLSVSATVAADQSAPASRVDSWRVTISRAGGEILAEELGSVVQGEAQVTGEFSLLLEARCEVLSVLIELSASSQVWYSAEPEQEVCAGQANRLPVQTLDFVRPRPEFEPQSLRLNPRQDEQSSSSFRIRYAGADRLAWSASVSPGANWLTLPVASGEVTGGQPQDVAVDIDTSGLNPGSYSASITISAAGFPGPVGTVLVDITFRAAPRLVVTPSTLDFTAVVGTLPEGDNLTVSNAGAGVLAWTASADVNWLSFGPSSGAVGPGGSDDVSVDVVSLPGTPGTYQGQITVADPDAIDSPQTVDVTLDLLERAAIALDRTSVSLSTPSGVSPPDETILLTNPGGLPLAWTASSDASWLTVSPTSGALDPGATAVPLTLAVSSTALRAGAYAGTVTVSDPEASNSPRSVVVALTVEPPVAPTLSALSASLRLLNDATCANSGSRFDISLDYDDPNGDVPVSGGRLQGTPLAFDWQFLPAGFSGGLQLDTDTSGDGFSGTLTFDLCVAFQVPENTGVRITYRLRDALTQWSAPVSIDIARPMGANAPPSGSGPGGVVGTGDVGTGG